MESELEQFKKQNTQLDLNIAELRLKLKATEKELYQERQTVRKHKFTLLLHTAYTFFYYHIYFAYSGCAKSSLGFNFVQPETNSFWNPWNWTRPNSLGPMILEGKKWRTSSFWRDLTIHVPFCAHILKRKHIIHSVRQVKFLTLALHKHPPFQLNGVLTLD